MNWMMKNYRFQITSLLFVLLVCSSCEPKTKSKQSRVEVLPYYNEATFTPRWIEKEKFLLDTFHRVPSFELINQEGDTITEKTFENKIYVTDFFFTSCPGICPKMMDNMGILQEEFEDDNDVLLLSHSVTPRRDSVPKLKAYAEAKDIRSEKWHITTGTQREIYTLGRKAYFVEEDLGLEKDVDEFLHTENFVLVDKKRHIRGIYNGLNMGSINQLIADMKTLKKEE